MLKKMKLVYLAVDEQLGKIIDEYRASLRPIPTNAEVVRELVKAGLKAKGYATPD